MELNTGFAGQPKKVYELGLLGGGQLARMIAMYSVVFSKDQMIVLDESRDCPAANYCETIFEGNIRNYDDVLSFGRKSKALVLDCEWVNVDALSKLENEGVTIYPNAETIGILQNKLRQKEFYREKDIPATGFTRYENRDEILQATNRDLHKYPFVWKSASGGYDGKGVQIIRNKSQVTNIPADCGACMIEEFVEHKKEIAVIVVIQNNFAHTYSPVEMQFTQHNTLDYQFNPTTLDPETQEKIMDIARRSALAFGSNGVFGVELFVTPSGEVLINEISPRVHNSGHHTIEANTVSQFRMMTDLMARISVPLSLESKPSIMINILGPEDIYNGNYRVDCSADVMKMIQDGEIFVHDYRKESARPNRKIGHATYLIPKERIGDQEWLDSIVIAVKNGLKIVSVNLD